MLWKRFFKTFVWGLSSTLAKQWIIKPFDAREIQYFQLGIFSFHAYVYYLTRYFIASTLAIILLTRALNLATHAFSVLACEFELVTLGFELVTCEFKLVSRRFELVTHRLELATRGFELVTRVLLFHIVYMTDNCQQYCH